MKRNFFLLLLSFIGTFSLNSCSTNDNSGQIDVSENNKDTSEYDLVIDLKMPGTLMSNIPNKTFKTLKIKGNINGTDIKYIRGLISNLSILDLGETNIVEGGESYYNLTHNTSNNIIGKYMFYKIMNGSTKLILPNSVTTIDEFAFAESSGIKRLVLGEKISIIGNEAFENNTGLTKLNIPSNVTDIGQQAFKGCAKLVSINLSDKLYGIDKGTFMECSNLREIIIPKGIHLLCEQAFSGCINLTKVELPDELNQIGYSCFSGCKTLSNIQIPSSVTTIDFQTFDGCNSLSDIKFPSTIKKLETSVLRGSAISQFEVPSSTSEICDYAFQNCNQLKKIIIGKNVSKLDYIPFFGCINLQNFDIDKSNPYFSTIDGVLYTKDKKTLIYFPDGKLISIYFIPDGTEEIGDASFMIKSTNIKTIYIPTTIKYIKERAFDNLKSLKVVHIQASTPPILGTNYGYNPFPTKVDSLYVPKGYLSKYNNNLWKQYFANIIEEK